MLSRGSEWRRWEPHIHAPGTVMNNQFSGPNAWGDYLTALEQATPVIANLVINTDADQIIVASAGPHPSGGLPPDCLRVGRS